MRLLRISHKAVRVFITEYANDMRLKRRFLHNKMFINRKSRDKMPFL